jgi:xanthine dehydrogenase small subunit
MRDSIRFLLGRSSRQLRGVSPTLTVLEYLRGTERLCGTKEGCAEGDCGACTVVLGEATGKAVSYRAVNACILFVPALDGKQLLTVEHLRDGDATLHPVQQAMIARHASQCGFCTPGFVMSLFALHHAPPAPDRAAVNDALAGNLCRCTGYRPIIDAALDACSAAPEPDADIHTAAALHALDTAEPLKLSHAGQICFAPRSSDQVAQILLQHPQAQLVAGGTDLGLWVTKQHRALDTIVMLEGACDLAAVEQDADTLRIGAAARYQAVLPALETHYPDFGALLRRLGSRQIRNVGTFGGNIANASPIGDTLPALIAVDATLVLRRGDVRRVLPLEAFFLGYRRTALAPGEFIERIVLPLPHPGQIFRCYKVAKRFDQDISAVCAAFRLVVAQGQVQDIRIGLGGLAATPVRGRQAEQALIGRPWNETTVRGAMAVLREEIAPISDMRASAAYRSMVAANLLFKCLLETAEPGHARTRLTAAA